MPRVWYGSNGALLRRWQFGGSTAVADRLSRRWRLPCPPPAGPPASPSPCVSPAARGPFERKSPGWKAPVQVVYHLEVAVPPPRFAGSFRLYQRVEVPDRACPISVTPASARGLVEALSVGRLDGLPFLHRLRGGVCHVAVPVVVLGALYALPLVPIEDQVAATLETVLQHTQHTAHPQSRYRAWPESRRAEDLSSLRHSGRR